MFFQRKESFFKGLFFVNKYPNIQKLIDEALLDEDIASGK